ncbi:hypothetical protein DLJ48_06950 [Oenococcus sicerae]|uniref:DUF4352 domain-containing protein n=1 Tax=Oenococcus sicerae TaxID=2203724 RepID=A0ABX5QN89_9LACO|nr:hypothetical protein [Oenococcus sicerae]QAS70275.1 hypothetical protein DLJ48_06950 [Oenococcus sicerae]
MKNRKSIAYVFGTLATIALVLAFFFVYQAGQKNAAHDAKSDKPAKIVAKKSSSSASNRSSSNGPLTKVGMTTTAPDIGTIKLMDIKKLDVDQKYGPFTIHFGYAKIFQQLKASTSQKVLDGSSPYYFQLDAKVTNNGQQKEQFLSADAYLITPEGMQYNIGQNETETQYSDGFFQDVNPQTTQQLVLYGKASQQDIGKVGDFYLNFGASYDDNGNQIAPDTTIKFK